MDADAEVEDAGHSRPGVLVATGLHALKGRSVAGLVLLTLPLFVGVGLVLGG